MSALVTQPAPTPTLPVVTTHRILRLLHAGSTEHSASAVTASAGISTIMPHAASPHYTSSIGCFEWHDLQLNTFAIVEKSDNQRSYADLCTLASSRDPFPLETSLSPITASPFVKRTPCDGAASVSFSGSHDSGSTASPTHDSSTLYGGDKSVSFSGSLDGGSTASSADNNSTHCGGDLSSHSLKDPSSSVIHTSDSAILHRFALVSSKNDFMATYGYPSSRVASAMQRVCDGVPKYKNLPGKSNDTARIAGSLRHRSVSTSTDPRLGRRTPLTGEMWSLDFTRILKAIRWIALRFACIKQAIEDNLIPFYHVFGNDNASDLLTTLYGGLLLRKNFMRLLDAQTTMQLRWFHNLN